MKTRILPAAFCLLFSLFFGLQSHSRQSFGPCTAPENFTKKFMKLEYQGGRLKAKGPIYALISDSTDEALDTAWVATKYKVASCEALGGDALVKVAFSIVGGVSSSALGVPEFTTEIKDEIVEIHLVKKNGNWKVTDSEHLRPHISVDAAVNYINQIAERNSFDPAYGKGAKKAITDLRNIVSPDRLPASFDKEKSF